MKEERIKEIEIDMATEGFYKNFNSKEIIEEYTRLKRELPLLYEKWEELV
ncbi:MAG: hypothetical protein BWY64_00933 [bacterium ADurb.Bin363]|nr:MAG: hypothetical protein BWY64_00933 [bacterium ADurb.Bin363]